LRVALLGPPIVERDGAPVHVDTRKAIALLAYLTLVEGPRPRDEMAALFWPELDSAGAAGALRRTLSTLRTALSPSALVANRQTVTISTEGIDVDVVRFRRAIRRVREHGHGLKEECGECLPSLREATGLYRADFLTGFSLRDASEFDDWQVAQSEYLRRLAVEALEGAGSSLAAAGSFEDAGDYVRRLLALDPLHEPAHRLLMRIFQQTGQRAAAIQQYRACVRVLDQELAVSPLEETTRLYQRIMEGESARSDGSPSPFLTGQTQAPQSPEIRELPLVGRAAEWAAILAAYDRAGRGPEIVVLEGEAGIGKTRLLEDLLVHARKQGSSVLKVRCFEGESNLPYAPIRALLGEAVKNLTKSGRLASVSPQDLGEAARLSPELVAASDHVAPERLDGAVGPAARVRLLEGIRRVLLADGADEKRVLLAVDDLHWADDASIECLAYLLRRLTGHRIAIILAWRTEETASLDPVRRIVYASPPGGLPGGRVTVVRLERLSPSAVRDLVSTGAPPIPIGSPPHLAGWLYQETEGIPLFLSEYLTAMSAGTLDSALPHGVRSLLLSRLDCLSETADQLLSVASVLGRSFEFDTVQAISGRDEDMTVTALEELVARGLLREVGDGGNSVPAYDFSHDKLRTLAYDRTSQARRRLLHRRAAQALAQGSGVHDTAQAGQIALHFEHAAMPAQAAEYHMRAGEYARSVFAVSEALAHFEAALALGHPDTPRLQEAMGDLHVLRGEYPSASRRYEAAAAVSGADGDRARIERKLGNACDRWGDWQLAESYYQAALALLTASELPLRAGVLADWSMAAYHRGDSARALDLARRAHDLAEQADDKRALAESYNILGVMEGSLGHRERAREHLGMSLALADSLVGPGARVSAAQNLSSICRQDGDLTEARRLTEEALALSSSLGDRHREAALHNAMADLLHASGEHEPAMDHLKKAVEIYAEIGVEDGELRPEVWKLSEW